MEFTQANKVFTRLDSDLQRFLAYCENLSDFEVKGKVGFLGDDDDEYTWKQYGKLPIHAPDWNFARLEEFKNKPMVGIRRLEVLCQKIEAQVPQEVLERHKELKRSKGDEPQWDGDWFLVPPAMEEALRARYGDGWRFSFMCQGSDEATWLHRIYHRQGQVPERMTYEEWRKKWRVARQPVEITAKPQPIPLPREQSAKATKTPLKINIKLVDLASEPDSFLRQKEALFRFARYLKRVPTVEEGLQYLHDQRLFTSSWEENFARRNARVRDILQWIANTFDASKCAKGAVNVGKFDAWAKKKFPTGLVGGKRRLLTEEGEVIEVSQHIHVSARFIACFMAVTEFGLLIDKNQDDTLPHRRAQQLWEALYAKGLLPVRFCARKWAVCRESLVEYGIITITNRDYRPGKAMEWSVGTYFPGLGLWKGKTQRGLGCLPRKRRRTTTRHNTWLRQQPAKSRLLLALARSRPPP